MFSKKGKSQTSTAAKVTNKQANHTKSQKMEFGNFRILSHERRKLLDKNKQNLKTNKLEPSQKIMFLIRPKPTFKINR